MLALTFPAGLTVKNLPAFHLLQGSLLSSEDGQLCCQLLTTLQTIWERDTANFFLLEWTVQSMAQVATCICRKPVPVQKQFFSMLEMVRVRVGIKTYFLPFSWTCSFAVSDNFIIWQVIFKLNYIPHETLRALLGVMKHSWAGTLAGGAARSEFGVVALKCFHR